MPIFPARYLSNSRPLGVLLLLLSLTGCSTPPIAGTLRTPESKPFTLIAEGKSLLMTPGPLTVELGDPPEREGAIRLSNPLGKLSIDTRPEQFNLNHFLIEQQEGILSSTIKGVWREETIAVYSLDELEYCTAPGFCLATVSRVVCTTAQGSKRGRVCSNIYTTEWVHSLSCPGMQPSHNTYQNYYVTVDLDFSRRESGAEAALPQGSFQGNSPPRKRRVAQLYTGPCLPR